eukprot:scaffold1970_cov21-Tisochrysis_lutea.AAC.1
MHGACYVQGSNGGHVSKKCLPMILRARHSCVCVHGVGWLQAWNTPLLQLQPPHQYKDKQLSEALKELKGLKGEQSSWMKDKKNLETQACKCLHGKRVSTLTEATVQNSRRCCTADCKSAHADWTYPAGVSLVDWLQKRLTSLPTPVASHPTSHPLRNTQCSACGSCMKIPGASYASQVD